MISHANVGPRTFLAIEQHLHEHGLKLTESLPQLNAYPMLRLNGLLLAVVLLLVSPSTFVQRLAARLSGLVRFRPVFAASDAFIFRRY
jgi:hypothetical protein